MAPQPSWSNSIQLSASLTIEIPQCAGLFDLQNSMSGSSLAATALHGASSLDLTAGESRLALLATIQAGIATVMLPQPPGYRGRAGAGAQSDSFRLA